MDVYLEKWKQAEQQKLGHSTLGAEFSEEYPTLAAVLSGMVASGDAVTAIPAASICLFEEAGRLKFCIQPKFGPRVAFGTFPDPVKGFSALEDELREGRFEWKISRRRASS